ncbi:MAG TPA: DNA polymerase IV [bacterium]|nr:DNA polymerase IV [bacterium]
MNRLIAHLDMNSFFVSCERLVDPSLNGKPVVVGGRRGERGVVASASYEARRFGIKSGMPILTAEKLCPQALFVPGHHRLYGKYSRKVYVLLRRLAPVVEYASIDEFYLDFTGCEALYGQDAWRIARKVRDAVLERSGLSCTVAIASNKYVAKIAGKTVKPSPTAAATYPGGENNLGVIVVPAGEEQKFLARLPIQRLHGAGEKTQPRLLEMRLKVIGDILPIPLNKLQKAFGPSAGQWLYEAARGLDDSPVTPHHRAKSVGNETTFEADTGDLDKVRRTLAWLSEKSCYRLRALKQKARTVTLKLRYDDFQTLTRARTLAQPTQDDVQVMETVWALFTEAHVRRRKIRLLGVSLSKFERGQEEQWLFPEMGSAKREALYQSVDAVKRKYGFHKLEKAASLAPRPSPGPSPFQKPKGR